MPALTAQDVAAIVAQVLAAQAAPQADPAPAPAVQAVSTARIASPFAAVRSASGATANVATRAIAEHPNDRRQARVQVAMSREPGFTCTVETTATLSDGTVVESALHGFLTAQTTGEKCPGVFGLPKKTECPGTIR